MNDYGLDQMEESNDSSERARSLARLIDRACKTSGTWSLVVVVPEPPEAPWEVELVQHETIRRFRLGKL